MADFAWESEVFPGKAKPDQPFWQEPVPTDHLMVAGGRGGIAALQSVGERARGEVGAGVESSVGPVESDCLWDVPITWICES